MTLAEKKEQLASRLQIWFKSQTKYGSYKDLALAAGLGQSTVKDYFSGRAFPSRKSWERLAAVADLEGIADLRGATLLFAGNGGRSPTPTPVTPPAPRLHAVLGGAPGEAPRPPTQDPHAASATDAPRARRSDDGGKPFIYSAYMATALTGLDRTARMGVIFISDCVARVCEGHGIELYEPRKATDPVHNATIKDHVVYLLDREKVTMSDLVIVLCEFPSFGAGQEIEIAGNATVPLVLLAMADKKPSRMVTGTPVYKRMVIFSDPDDLAAGLDAALHELEPHLQERRRRMVSAPIPLDIGRRVKVLRKNARLDQGELATAVGVSEQFIRNLENSDATITNLSLIQLASLVRVLKVPYYELLGEADADGEPLPADSIRWARERGVPTNRLHQVLNYAARSKPGSPTTPLSHADLDKMIRRLEEYEREIGE